jgi:hypothetical protein
MRSSRREAAAIEDDRTTIDDKPAGDEPTAEKWTDAQPRSSPRRRSLTAAIIDSAPILTSAPVNVCSSD